MDTSLTSATAHAEHQARLARPRILRAAKSLYVERGVVAVSLADIAHYLSVPESMVEQWFPSKDQLVQDVMEAHKANIHDAFLQHKESSRNAVEEMLAVRTWVRQEMYQSQNLFLGQVEAHYPASWQQWLDFRAGFLLDHVRTNLGWGISQNLYRDNLNVDFLARLWLQQMGSLSTAAALGLDPAEAHHALVDHFLSGIVTANGAYVLRRLQEAPPFY
jgi:AcrR family transcriptional regulator